ncbi:hypothetical protein QR680_006274 [Steinernema hermaphroditum]|uniref:Uncharacterized protein n=1 Tax=Steinernema hermaphroditum TaxID=289476 RepID=A0AA39LX50_9BILA|nr:hypothetical protein QR680_006274 [Steinernema hermaphroditum]
MKEKKEMKEGEEAGGNGEFRGLSSLQQQLFLVVAFAIRRHRRSRTARRTDLKPPTIRVSHHFSEHLLLLRFDFLTSSSKMMGTLVNKFEQQSLQDHSPTMELRKSARISAAQQKIQLESILLPNFGDSGTESEDDELEQLSSAAIDTQDRYSRRSGSAEPLRSPAVLRASRTLEDVVGPSPPALTSSPPLASEFDTNSWDSMGCESGIVLRYSEERDSLSNHSLDFGHSFNSSDALADISSSSSTISLTAGGNSGKPGAFKPVTGKRRSQNVSTLSLPNAIGEKRSWDSSNSERMIDFSHLAPVASRTRSGTLQGQNSPTDISRPLLTACRRQPVRLIIHNPSGAPHRRQIDSQIPNEPVNLSQSPPSHPMTKRGRRSSGGGPGRSLDFEKMREKMMDAIAMEPFCNLSLSDEKRKEWVFPDPSTFCKGRCVHVDPRNYCPYCGFDFAPSEGLESESD